MNASSCYCKLTKAESSWQKQFTRSVFAHKQYIPNTPVNRKRLIGMGMEEKGIENTPRNFKKLYNVARKEKMFEKMLAKPEEARTTFSSRLMVEVARRKRTKG